VKTDGPIEPGGFAPPTSLRSPSAVAPPPSRRRQSGKLARSLPAAPICAYVRRAGHWRPPSLVRGPGALRTTSASAFGVGRVCRATLPAITDATASVTPSVTNLAFAARRAEAISVGCGRSHIRGTQSMPRRFHQSGRGSKGNKVVHERIRDRRLGGSQGAPRGGRGPLPASGRSAWEPPLRGAPTGRDAGTQGNLPDQRLGF
jgi:hypothetical protein